MFYFKQAPNRPAQPEGFGSTAGSGGFADFADFDTKVGNYTVRWDRW